MGALAPGSAHARPSAQAPIDTSGNFSEQVSGGNHFLINFLAISGDFKHFSFYLEKKQPKNVEDLSLLKNIIFLALEEGSGARP